MRGTQVNPHLSMAIVPWVASRAALVLAVYFTLRSTTIERPDPSLDAMPLRSSGDSWRAFPDLLWLDGWIRWDSAWYWNIVNQGYAMHAGDPSNVAFFPLYPLVSWTVSLPFRLALSPDRAFYLAGFIVSQAAFLLALLGLARLGVELVGHDGTKRSLWLLCLSPFSFFFSAAYTESLYLALAVWSFYWAQRNRWVAACVLAALCSATRSLGILLAPILALQYWAQRGDRSAAVGKDALALLIAPLGLLLFMVYLWLHVGDPLAFMHVQAAGAWERSLSLFYLRGQISYVLDPGNYFYDRAMEAWQLLFLVSSLALSFLAMWRLGPGYGLFALASSLVVMFSGSSLSMGRLLSVLFPIFLVAGSLLKSRIAFVSACVLMSPFLISYACGFARWYFAPI